MTFRVVRFWGVQSWSTISHTMAAKVSRDRPHDAFGGAMFPIVSVN